MAQRVKDPELPKQWHRWQLQLRFDPQLGNLLPHAAGAVLKSKKKKKTPDGMPGLQRP